jgi:hypothetical protein
MPTRGLALRLHDGKYECVLCGVTLDVPTEGEPSVIIKAASGAPNIRTIVYEGVEIHACEVPDTRRSTRS